MAVHLFIPNLSYRGLKQTLNYHDLSNAGITDQLSLQARLHYPKGPSTAVQTLLRGFSKVWIWLVLTHTDDERPPKGCVVTRTQLSHTALVVRLPLNQ